MGWHRARRNRRTRRRRTTRSAARETREGDARRGDRPRRATRTSHGGGARGACGRSEESVTPGGVMSGGRDGSRARERRNLCSGRVHILRDRLLVARKKLRRLAFARTPRGAPSHPAGVMSALATPVAYLSTSTILARARAASSARYARRVPVARASHESWSRERDGPFYSSDSVDYSYDGEAYPLTSQTVPFTEPFTTDPRPGSWTSPTSTPGDAAGDPRWDAGDARTPSTWTHTSAHARHPHVVSIKLPRPVSKHLAFAPRRLPAARTYNAELQVRPRDPRPNDERMEPSSSKPREGAEPRAFFTTPPRPTRSAKPNPDPNLSLTPRHRHSPLPIPHTFPLGRDLVRRRPHGGCCDCRVGVSRPRGRTHPTGRRSRLPLRRTARSDGMVRGRCPI